MPRQLRWSVQAIGSSPKFTRRWALSWVGWLYLRFQLSLRDVEEMLAERGLDISCKTIRRWVTKFGTAYAKRLKAGRAKPIRRWHLDEMFVSIGGRPMYLWRAVDAEREVLDILVQRRRDKRAALKLLRNLLKKQEIQPEAIVTNKLKSYAAALRSLGMQRRQVTGGRSNSRAENSRQPVRRRERSWLGFKNMGSTHRFLSAHTAVYNTFNLQRHLISRRTLRNLPCRRFRSMEHRYRRRLNMRNRPCSALASHEDVTTPGNQDLMLDTTLVRVHQQAAAGKGGAKIRLWGVP